MRLKHVQVVGKDIVALGATRAER